MSLFCCPLCGRPLKDEANALRCPSGHSFDRAKEGYVHLLPAGQKNSRMPGDNKAMASARRAFLDRGWYEPLRGALCRLAAELTGPAPAVLDAGCGEGYYTAGIRDALLSAGKTPETAGFDISKFSVQKAAKRYKGIEFAVASSYRLPAADNTFDLLVNVFSPLAVTEFHRVLRPGGMYLYVVPGAMHLWEMKEILYDQPYPNEEKEIPYPGFSSVRVVCADYTMHLPAQTDIHALFQMTPYFWKTPKAGAERLAALESLGCRAAFRIHIFRRE